MAATLNADELSELTSFAEELADISGKVIMPHFRERIAIHNKLGDKGFDPVMEASTSAPACATPRR